MAFNKTNDDDLALLKSEVNTDPIGMNYAQFIDSSTKKFMELLNDADKNVEDPTPTTGITLTAMVLFDNMAPADFGGNQTSANDGDRLWLGIILGFIHSDPSQNVEKWKAKILAMAPNNSTTEQNLDALIRDVSRAEVLFGIGTSLSDLDWAAARDS